MSYRVTQTVPTKNYSGTQVSWGRSLLGLVLLVLSAQADGDTPENLILQTAILACRTPVAEISGLADRLPGMAGSQRGESRPSRRRFSESWTFSLVDGGRIKVERIAPQDRLREVRAEMTHASGHPMLWLRLDHRCAPRDARSVRYDDAGDAVETVYLDARLQPTGRSALINPPVPPGAYRQGVRVAFVDSGVNYLLPQIKAGLARRPDGSLIGFDFWDLDDRPFDVHTPRSLFFVQRHGTRTASIILEEAPEALIVPYRYPRPEMTRMRDLIQHAARHEVRIMAMPLGSNRRLEWRAFAEAARAHPEILFIASAGNSGRNIDEHPVYPASLRLPNLVSVSSADDHGRPAERVNWGPQSVHLLVPAEQRSVINYNGRPGTASGSSYAVTRIAALAARVRSRQPDISTDDLKARLFRDVVKRSAAEYVAVGYLPDPRSDDAAIELTGPHFLLTRPTPVDGLGLNLSIAMVADSGWQESMIPEIVHTTADVLSQCGIALSRAQLFRLRVSPYLMDFQAGTAKTIIDRTMLPTPTVFLVRDTLMALAFEGEAFGTANTSTRPWLRNTVWLIKDVQHPEIALPHELLHVLSDSGEHVGDGDNLMQEQTGPDHTVLTPAQCAHARETGLAHGLLNHGR